MSSLCESLVGAKEVPVLIDIPKTVFWKAQPLLCDFSQPALFCGSGAHSIR